ncbi:MAG TPA: hypothetical protein VJL88_13265 [Nitrospira sp.]|nr:hypothetical protein [Nitrospira sp.]
MMRTTSKALVCLVAAHFAFPNAVYSYEQDVDTWMEVSRPAGPRTSGIRMAWEYAANHSKYEWKVFKEGPTVKAVLTKDDTRAKDRPFFTPQAEGFKDGFTFFRTDDGWLVSFNRGEFGSALYWFDQSGDSRQKISDHQVRAFFPCSEGVLAIEGLAHLTMSFGSIIRITRTKQWEANTVTLLPEAPYAGAMSKDGTLFLVLSGSLAEYSKIGNRETLKLHEKNGDWGTLYPNSLVLKEDEKKAYIGMRQFVVEYDFRRRILRFLIPDESFLNKLPKEQEDRIRKQWDEMGK